MRYTMLPRQALTILKHHGLCMPKKLTIAITRNCNLACAHCWVEAGQTTAVDSTMPESVIRRLLQEFLALQGERICFTGGEPLCHPGFLGMLRTARTLGFEHVTIQTNGMLITDGWVSAVKQLNFRRLSIQISLDGANSPSHDLVRGKGAFGKALAGITRLVREGMGRNVQLFFTEMHHNLHEIPALLELADHLGVNSVTTGCLVRCGRAATEASILPPDPDAYLKLLHRYDTDPAFRELYRKLGSVAALEWRHDSTPRVEGCTFVENPYVTAGGKLYPCVICHIDDYSVTGVMNKNLAASFVEGAAKWSSLLQKSMSRFTSIPECAGCAGRFMCRGGCMGRAWGSCGDLGAADDRCSVRRCVYQISSPLGIPET